jgi:hypothetical protein
MSNDTLDLDALGESLRWMTAGAWTVDEDWTFEINSDISGAVGKIVTREDAYGLVALRKAAPRLIARARESATKDARIAALTAALRDALDLAEGPAIIEAATSDLESVARLRALLGTEGDNG